jgi:hypothetical protein
MCLLQSLLAGLAHINVENVECGISEFFEIIGLFKQRHHIRHTKLQIVCVCVCRKWERIIRKNTIRYSGRKITESLGNVTVRGEKKDGKSKKGARRRSLSEHV